MTYVAAFPCREGYVCCADTLETIGDGKQYVEKLEVFENGECSFCIGGAGTGEIIDALTQEISERVLCELPESPAALRICVTKAVRDVYENDVPVMALKKQLQTAQLLIAANTIKAGSRFCLLRVQGKRVRQVERAIIGFATNTNNSLLKRFHTPDMPMSRAIMLAAYLLAQSKAIDDGVGGDTTIAVVSHSFARIEEPRYVRSIETIVSAFLPVSDSLFLHLSDVGLSHVAFEENLCKFVALLREQREVVVKQALEYIQFLVDNRLLSNS